jgi:pentose-5-phosphate-3-epimerase
LAEVDPSILNLNQNYNHNYFEITEEAKLKIMHFLTEDIVMYNQFLNKTTTLDVIINAIKQEKDFIKDMTQYKKAINYLF